MEPKQESKINVRLELNNILKIIFQAQESYKILQCLCTSSGDEIEDGIKDRSYFFLYCKERFFKDTIIELAKLFNAKNTEDFSLIKFKNKLYNDDDFKGVIESDVLKNWSDMLKSANDIIKKIIENRNRYVAHTDREFNPEKFPLSLNDLKVVISIAQKIAKDILWILEKASFQIDAPIGSPVDSLKHIINELGENEKNRLRPFLKEAYEYKSDSNIPDWFEKELQNSSDL
ncbi:MAG TPA: hypothetical protein VHA52_12185 [Candidatus Babeliaceae bacterium]|nr:hypothetical protein [Candidatus Babeliaceae bacterium]